jgi:signal transduction histidine kinase
MLPASLGPLDLVGVAAVGTLLTVAGALLRRRDAPSAPALAALVACLGAWSVAILLAPAVDALLGTALANAAPVVVLGIAGALFAPVCWFWYAVAYTGRHGRLTPARLGLLATPALVAVPAAYGLRVAGGSLGAVFAPVVALLVLVIVVYGVSLSLLGTYLLIGLTRRYRQVPLAQVLALTGAVTLPYLSTVLSSVTQPRNGEMVALLPLDVTPVGFLLSGLLFGLALRRYPVLTVLPEATSVARDEVVEELPDAVVVLDRTGEVLDLNAAAARLVDRPTAALGHPIEDVLDVEAASLGETPSVVDLETPDGVRQFEVTASSLGASDRSVGRTVLLRDVTDREAREQRLAVLNRVLRHNVRNELDVLLAHADRIDDEDRREAVRAPATNLVETAKKARDTERMLADDAGDTERVDLVTVATAVADACRERYPAAEIRVSAPDERVVTTRETVVERVLLELVENAVEHADTDAPHVEVTLTEGSSGGAATLRVRDDGPGLPERERRLVREEESPQDHASGVGLWLVARGVDHLGGDLAFGDADPRGTVVTVRLPADAGGA